MSGNHLFTNLCQIPNGHVLFLPAPLVNHGTPRSKSLLVSTSLLLTLFSFLFLKMKISKEGKKPNSFSRLFWFQLVVY